MTVKEQLDRRTRLLKAISHPLRQKILVSLNREVSSPSQLAGELDEPLGNVSYHVKILEDYEAIELVDTAPRRGAVEHFYRAIARPYIEDDHWTELPLSARRALFDQTLQQIWDHMAEASENGGYDDPETHISWTTLDLDQEGYAEVATLLAETLNRALEIQAESAGRLNALPADERESRRTELAIAHYDRPAARKGSKGRRKRAAVKR
jgi:DNA-binding transcriptional ArsR family regulator